MADLTPQALTELINHVFLPPHLPQQNDSGCFSDLMKVSLKALAAFSKASPAHSVVLNDAIELLAISQAIHSLSEDNISEHQLLHALQHRRPAFLHVRAQNAGILVTFDTQGNAVVEQFEVSALNKDVMTTEGRLVRTFPGSAVCIKSKIMGKTGFQSTFAHTLAVMCYQAAAEMQPQTKKRGEDNAELRDTTHPGLVSELFVGGFLNAAGSPASVSSISKHTRDDILWKNVKLPWRRSPDWLLIKVSLQLTLSRATGGSVMLYKHFLVFLMAQIMELGVATALSSELLHVMNAKVARRLEKLQCADDYTLASGTSLDRIRRGMEMASQELSKRWTCIQKRQNKPLPMSDLLSKLDLERDSLHCLPHLDQYIATLRRRPHTNGAAAFAKLPQLKKLDSTSLPSTITATDDPDYACANLQQFEMWICLSLENWGQSHGTEPDACSRLRGLLSDYHSVAQRTYADNPEALSVMMLTLLEIWVTCDQIATRTCPLLRRYDPKIPQEVFQNLLLLSKTQMARLRAVEIYMTERSEDSEFPPAKLFALRSSDSFPVQYFEQSPLHQDMLRQIKTKAKEDKKAKLSEFAKLRAEYARLSKLYEQTSCDFVDVVIDTWQGVEETERQHSRSCGRCGYLTRANKLEINVFEEPLPEDSIKAKAVVFELRPPSWYHEWRDTRTYILRNVLQGKYCTLRPRAEYPLSKDRHLSSPHLKAANRSQRLVLLSQDKPNVVTHYREKAVGSSAESDVCKQSGVNYEYYDSSDGVFFGELQYEQITQLAFVYELPRPLQPFVFRPSEQPDGPPHNLVIASQDQCPGNMTVDEYKELCTLPLGHRIQWQNVLLQLTSPSVDFKKPETALVFLQCLHQTGPPDSSTSLRETHAILRDDKFAAALLSALVTARKRVEKNWESSQALGVFIAIAARLLSLSRSKTIRQQCMVFLDSAREIALGWVITLREKAFVDKSVEIALLCAMTFDVDTVHLSTILAHAQNASTLVQLSITVREGRLYTSSETLFSLLRLRFTRLLHRAYTMLASDTRGLDLAVQSSWSAYCPGASWNIVSAALDYWLVTQTAATYGGQPMAVHYNTLTGELLVNGLPVDRPPRRFEDASLYRTLFGHAAVKVMPSTVRGMLFSTKESFHGYRVNLGMSEKGDLLVQTLTTSSKDTSGPKSFEVIPARLLKDDFPASFGDSFIHFHEYTRVTAEYLVEFRPIDNPWDSGAPGTWQLKRRVGGNLWRLTRLGDGDALISVKSETARVIAKIFRPLASPAYIHNTIPASRPLVGTPAAMEVELPRLRLGFSLSEDGSVLWSHQYREMQVDDDQSLGTLVGFENKLMLRSTSKSHGTRRRMLLLLEAAVTYNKDGLWPGHTKVTIDMVAKDIQVHTFGVDTQLGRLTGSGSLDSKLFLVLLHALTTFCLPDPLTSKTGTEQALAELNSAAVRSFDQLTEHHIHLLTRIAALTPGRSYYPRDKCVMQQVDWNTKIGPLAQHGGFHSTVASIFEQAKRSEIFYPASALSFPGLVDVNPVLLKRDSIRSSSFRVSGFGAEDHTPLRDVHYTPRDMDQTSQRSLNAFLVSSYIFNDRKTLQWSMAGENHLWELMADLSKVSGRRVDLADLKYDIKELSTGQNDALRLWPGIHTALKARKRGNDHKFSFMIWLSTMGFSQNVDLQFIQTLAALFTCDNANRVSTPVPVEFNPSRGKEISIPELQTSLHQQTISYRRIIVREPGEKLRRWEARDAAERRQHEQSVALAVKRLAKGLREQGCRADISSPAIGSSSDITNYIRVDQAMDGVKPLFKMWHENALLHEYLLAVESTIRACSTREQRIPALPPDLLPMRPSTSPGSIGYVSIDHLFASIVPPDLPADREMLESSKKVASRRRSARHQSPLLHQLIEKLGNSTRSSPYKQGYVDNLAHSLDALHREDVGPAEFHGFVEQDFVDHIRDREKRERTVYAALMCAVTRRNSGALLANQYPRLSPELFLSQLSHGRWPKLTLQWQAAVVEYGLALTKLQRAERMLRAFRKSGPSSADLLDELHNAGHRNWDPLSYPESLLIEVENGLMIREVQERIASEMRAPQDGHNATMQLNMGQGKSSLIVPMVACALADGSQLVRVIVAKPQSKQMADMLKSKLGAVVGRRIYYMPFSRSLKLDRAAAETVFAICQECMRNGGILLVQPEHILSFKLMAPECFIANRDEVARSLLRTQDFFDAASRDIVDESDENFSVKFELIYTMGTQRPIEKSPDRWTYIQQVLELVRTKAPAVVEELGRSSMEIHDGPTGAFPRVRLLRPDAESLLLHKVARHICDFGLDAFPLGRQPKTVQDDLYAYMTQRDPPRTVVDAVQNGGPTGFWTESTKSTILLLRGLLAGGVLAFTLRQKRWRVNFGLATRTPPTKLSVPFRAKDSPTPRSEFSHPDVVITLTSLCYYYGVLDDEDVFTALGHLMTSDQADIEYQAWVRDASHLDPAFAQLQGINIKDREQCISRLFPSLNSSKSVVDYYLSRIVFPKEMKEFPDKLSASGWDIGKRKARPTTGFSGTSDSQIMLPLDVHHMDLPEQKHTDALVLECLLRAENTVEPMSSLPESTLSDAERILSLILQLRDSPEVILDVGAQILELDNLQVAQKWLQMRRRRRSPLDDDDNTKEAVVFVNLDDELSVVDRKGRVELFQTSSFTSRLEACLVFLDEAHTRGTHLDLPSDYRAAVTLGADLTKDRLVQACMRMRRLGEGQSVAFLVSEEIQTKIRECAEKRDDDPIEVVDVLQWAISETLDEMHRSMPLWATQGRRYIEQEQLMDGYTTDGHTVLSKERAETFLAPEAQTIEQRYRPRTEPADVVEYLSNSSNHDKLRLIAERCQRFRDLKFNSSTLQEEQERELSPEIERERQVQRPAPAQPGKQILAPDVREFAVQAVLRTPSEAYFPAFEALRDTSGARDASGSLLFDVTSLAGNLMVTADFARTVEVVVKSGSSDYRSDQYQRSVQWIVSRRDRKTVDVDVLMIISPFEANSLILDISRSTHTALHLFKARCNSGFPSLDSLQLYKTTAQQRSQPVPRILAIPLGLFAGQLYFASYEDYRQTCRFLGLTIGATPPGWDVTPDGFIMWDGTDKRKQCENPIQFIKFLMTTIRRNGQQGIAKTDLGGLLEGKLFQRSDFEEEPPTSSGSSSSSIAIK